ncbi:SRPBCC domain-containing protein [Microcoleus sp. FACHB-1515]|uniref:SRPBCC family protein n=1 Tax=Cyanophyceae TaxID=3028117 RepID=UPI001686F048|nr:SRPBCC family protein [Microcoleus sp. FACHB-1515]MBD2090072.1 SRPBCC domain-containing protein [Microcoleus sp. FACHB-1515]
METLTIKKTVSIHTPPSVVFDALTTSEKIVQYYPLKEVTSTWKVGDEIFLKGAIEDLDFTDYGRIEILLPNEKFQYSYWSDNHGTERTPKNYSTICYTLHETDSGTKLEMEHQNLKTEEMYLKMLDVWDFLLSSLKDFVEKK